MNRFPNDTRLILWLLLPALVIGCVGLVLHLWLGWFPDMKWR